MLLWGVPTSSSSEPSSCLSIPGQSPRQFLTWTRASGFWCHSKLWNICALHNVHVIGHRTCEFHLWLLPTLGAEYDPHPSWLPSTWPRDREPKDLQKARGASGAWGEMLGAGCCSDPAEGCRKWVWPRVARPFKRISPFGFLCNISEFCMSVNVIF